MKSSFSVMFNKQGTAAHRFQSQSPLHQTVLIATVHIVSSELGLFKHPWSGV